MIIYLIIIFIIIFLEQNQHFQSEMSNIKYFGTFLLKYPILCNKSVLRNLKTAKCCNHLAVYVYLLMFFKLLFVINIFFLILIHTDQIKFLRRDDDIKVLLGR